MTATTIHVRLDAKASAMLDELTAHYAQRAAQLGLSYSRSDAVRVILRAAHADLRDELARRDAGQAHTEALAPPGPQDVPDALPRVSPSPAR
jgi:Arc/MetJ-type ribon-helix-helix transcriptional regulator